MPGIEDIVNSRAEEVASRVFADSKSELFLKDGDVAVVSPVPSGSAEDLRLDHFYVHSKLGTSKNGKRFVDIKLCKAKTKKFNGMECTPCAEGNKATHKFGFWVYVHFIIHPSQSPNKEKPWKEVKALVGKKVNYQEDVNQYRVLSLGFGQKDYLWKQIVEIWTVNGGKLDVAKLRISRSGSQREDTSYNISAMMEKTELPETDETRKLAELQPIVDFFEEKGADRPQQNDDNEETVTLGDSDQIINDGGSKKESLF